MANTHPLLVGTRELFENARPSSLYLSLGFLRPYTRKLPDIIVTRDNLPRALEAANALYLHLERRACPVTLATRGLFRRDVPDRGGRDRERLRDEVVSRLMWKMRLAHFPAVQAVTS